MDSSKKINKSKSLPPKPLRKSSITAIKTSSVKTQEAIEDRRLRNWRKWLENRERTCDHLKSLTGRKSEDLLLNSYEKIRPKIEIQNLLEAAADSVLPDKSKADLNFWTTPVYLKNRRDPENPEIALSLTKKRLKIPRILSRVFLPELTQREKCLTLPKPPALPEKHSEYLRRKLAELSPQISKLNLKIGDVDQVAVEGKRIPDKQRIILKINDEEIVFDEDSMKKPQCTRFSLDFFSKKSQQSERFICLDNKTFENLIYKWQEPVSDRDNFSRMQTGKFFHFAKPSDIISPGRCGELIIRYQPQAPGVHLESVILETFPRLSQSPMVLSLWGVCEEPGRFPNRIIDYQDYLNVRFRNSVVSGIIEEIWGRVESPPPRYPPHALYFLEREVFAAKNPGFSYDREAVGELKRMLEGLVRRDPWALSLSELQDHILRVHDANGRSEMLNKFGKLCRGLRGHRRWELSISSRHQVVFNLVSGFASQFSVESECVKTLCAWGAFKVEGVQDDVSKCSGGARGEEESESSRRRERGRGKALNSSTGSIVSDIQEYWDTGGQEGIYDVGLYHEVFCARIYHLLGETVDKISAAVDGINHLGGGFQGGG
ncbi:uncharacterized protein LOC114841373 [Diachasma alloeum]|uniref:uncharacterized protein LOC114841373 n=1 Tax=Diachasma alloeum TaxID=454923 RepID=UPI0010FB498E|nr:uncharacterized protein LOC114841373 [Diachasma alloeum]